MTMRTDFIISAIENKFDHLFDQSREELALKSAVKMVVGSKPGYP